MIISANEGRSGWCPLRPSLAERLVSTIYNINTNIIQYIDISGDLSYNADNEPVFKEMMMNTFVVASALAGLVIALKALKTPKGVKVRVPVTNPTSKRKRKNSRG